MSFLRKALKAFFSRSRPNMTAIGLQVEPNGNAEGNEESIENGSGQDAPVELQAEQALEESDDGSFDTISCNSDQDVDELAEPVGQGMILQVPEIIETPNVVVAVYPRQMFPPEALDPSMFVPEILAPPLFPPEVLDPPVFPPEVLDPPMFPPEILAPEALPPQALPPQVLPPEMILAPPQEPNQDASSVSSSSSNQKPRKSTRLSAKKSTLPRRFSQFIMEPRPSTSTGQPNVTKKVRQSKRIKSIKKSITKKGNASKPRPGAIQQTIQKIARKVIPNIKSPKNDGLSEQNKTIKRFIHPEYRHIIVLRQANGTSSYLCVAGGACKNANSGRAFLKSNLRNHISCDKQKKFTCNVCCRRTFPTENALEAHKNYFKKISNGTTPKRGTIYCECGKAFSNMIALNRHKENRKSRLQKKPKCHSCNTTFSSKITLRAHMRVMHR